ncbi:hypothetical protein X798_05797 [Onchocerca flexuosa]|uniref:Uncharacterized protein n=1 Tax=Onchocerca flexuosa TaxID=387005 RepID=A0A238BP96_9BILA|nr:hypothetical protein X798_05797 [Onchocerca flexuosa]
MLIVNYSIVGKTKFDDRWDGRDVALIDFKFKNRSKNKKNHNLYGNYHIKESSVQEMVVSTNKLAISFSAFDFTQNLSSVLLDPKCSRAEVQTFFTRHWSDSFVPKTHISPALSLPTISIDHFQKYLKTTAKKHRQCLRAKYELRRALARHEEDTRIDVDDVPVGEI